MLATQKGRSKPVRISCRRSEKVIEFSRSVWRGRPRPRQGKLTRAFRISSATNPATRMTFLRLVWPDAMVTEEGGTFKRFARNSIQARLARPSDAGAVSDSLSASPTSPDGIFLGVRVNL